MPEPPKVLKSFASVQEWPSHRTDGPAYIEIIAEPGSASATEMEWFYHTRQVRRLTRVAVPENDLGAVWELFEVTEVVITNNP